MVLAGEDGNVWSFNFFFYNKKMKRIVYFSCRGLSKASNSADDSDYYESAGEEDEGPTRYGMADQMDL